MFWGFLRTTSLRLCIGKRVDYAVCALLGTLPILVAFLIHAGLSGEVAADSLLKHICPQATGIKGYFQCPNWMMFPLALPLGLWVLRWMSQRLSAVRDPNGSSHPLVQLLPEAGRNPLRQRLRDIALDGRLLLGAFSVATICMVVDLKEQEAVYWKVFSRGKTSITTCPRQIDWTYYCLSKQPTQPGYVSPQKDLALIGVAYLCQYLIITFAFFVTFLITAHNYVYLRTVFRRSAAKSEDPDLFFGISFDDDNKRCFGLKAMHVPFNAQLIFLSISAAFILISRFAIVGPLSPDVTTAIADTFLAPRKGYRDFTTAVAKIPLDKLFPTTGQIMLAIGWIFCFSAVMMPVFLKFLPLVNKQIWSGGINEFLLEFLKDTNPYAKDPMPPDLSDALAKKFAQNSFWPTGDRRARLLFYLAFFALLLILFPVLPDGPYHLFLLGYLLFLVVLAVTFTTLLFYALRVGLSHVDERLTSTK